ncbi:hypothetical protein ACFOEQ_14785 [Chryseobacterium arachidis]|uniref:hypothetical protein n=1 Tax=Chryseobacterium arachidis TaxID=1416778 RepID=UPI00360693DD
MIASTLSNLFTQRTMGLNVKANKKFFANFRFAVPSQAEIITSKGLAGIGKNFFVGVSPNTTAKPYVNSTIGFVATEDNTTVTLSNYNPGVVSPMVFLLPQELLPSIKVNLILLKPEAIYPSIIWRD